MFASFNLDATDELRYLGESSLEVVAGNVSRLFEYYLLHVFIFMPSFVFRKERLGVGLQLKHRYTQLLHNTVECMTEK